MLALTAQKHNSYEMLNPTASSTATSAISEHVTEIARLVREEYKSLVWTQGYKNPKFEVVANYINELFLKHGENIVDVSIIETLDEAHNSAFPDKNPFQTMALTAISSITFAVDKVTGATSGEFSLEDYICHETQQGG